METCKHLFVLKRFSVFRPSLAVLLLIYSANCSVAVQEANVVPENLRVRASGGGLHPWEENLTVQVSASGEGRCSRYVSGDVGQPPSAEQEFSIPPEGLAPLWQVIEAQSFFDLEEEFIAEDVTGGTFLTVGVVADGMSHQVTAQNVAVPALDAIVEALDSITPEPCRLQGFVNSLD